METRIKCITTKFKTNNFNAFGNLQVMVKISDNNFKIHLPYCYSGTTDCPYFVLHVALSMGFKARVVLLPKHLLVLGKPKGHIWCYTCLFPKKGCTLYKHVNSKLTFQTSLMQAAEGRHCSGLLTWAAVRFDLGLPTRQSVLMFMLLLVSHHFSLLRNICINTLKCHLWYKSP